MKTNLERIYQSELSLAKKEFLKAKKEFDKAEKKYAKELKSFLGRYVPKNETEFEFEFNDVVRNLQEGVANLACCFPEDVIKLSEIYETMIGTQICLIHDNEIPDIKLNKKKMGAK